MSLSNLGGWLGLVVPLFVFILVASSAFRSPPRSALSFLYRMRPVRLSTAPAGLARVLTIRRWIRVASVAATNLSVVSAFVYMIDGGSKNGLLVLLIPLGVIVGYRCLRTLLAWANPDGKLMEPERGGLLLTVDRGASHSGAPSKFAVVLTCHWIAVYVLFAFFELVICAKLLAVAFGVKAGTVSEFLIATTMFLAALLYSQSGGVRSVMQVDWVQLLAGGGCVVALLWWLLSAVSSVSMSSVDIRRILFPPGASIPLMLQGFVLSITTQFYNPYNWHAGSVVPHPTVTGREAQRELDLVWKWGAIVTALILFALAIAGILISDRAFQAPTFAVIQSVATSAPQWIRFLVVAGLLSLTISTIDGLMIALVANWYQTFLRGKRSPWANATIASHGPSEEDSDIFGVRKILLLLYLLGMLVMVPFYFLAPPQQVVTLLLLMGSGVSVLFPLLVLAVWLYRTNRLNELRNRVVYAFVGLFWASWIISGVVFKLAPRWLDLIPLVFMSTAGVVALVIGLGVGGRGSIISAAP